MFKRLLTLFLVMAGLVSCAGMAKNHQPLYESSDYYNYLQPDFETYIEISRQWLTQNRAYVSEEHEREVDMNAPFALHPEKPSNKAILLVHGLGDSPFSFRDVAASLKAQGYHVYALLLPGHGSRPAHLLTPTNDDWQEIVDFYAAQLKNRHSELWLGGFSTGANLVTTHTLQQNGVKGLLLFSPGFQSHVPWMEKLAPLLAAFVDWGWEVEENNMARYRSSPLNAAIAYSDSAEVVRDLLSSQKVSVPTFIVMSEADSVIDPYAIRTFFNERFTHSDNRMLWYGESLKSEGKILVSSMWLPAEHISTGSHMSPLFAPENPYYGRQGQKRMCLNSMSRSDTERCEQGEEVWFSAWGYTEKDKIHARLTWNPYFDDMTRQIVQFLGVY